MSDSSSSGAAPQGGLSSPAKVDANRRNGLKSDGPSTERGKARSKCNALKYGLTSSQVVIERIDGEDAFERFAALHQSLCEQFLPVGPVSEFRVQRVAANIWRLQRHDRAEAAMLEEASLRAAQDNLLRRFRFPGTVSEHMPTSAATREPHSHRLRLLIERLVEFEAELQRNGGVSAESSRDLIMAFGTYDPFAVECAVVCATAKPADPGPNGKHDSLPPGTIADQNEQAARLMSEKRQQLSEVQLELEHLEQQERSSHLTTLCIPSPMNLERLWRSRTAINKELEQDLACLNEKQHQKKNFALSGK